MIFTPSRLRELCPQPPSGTLDTLADALEDQAVRLSFVARQVTLSRSEIRKFAHWGCDGGLGIVSKRNTLISNAISYAACAARCLETLVRNAVDSYWREAAPIFSTLLLWRRPPAITRLVMSIMIESVNGVGCRRSRSHVLKECLKRLVPSVANHDAAPTPVGKVMVRLIGASPLHAEPSFVLGRRHPPSLVAVLRSSGGFGSGIRWVGSPCLSPLILKAAAGRQAAILEGRGEVGRIANHLIAAIALAVPQRSSSLGWDDMLPQDRKSSKFFAGYVVKPHGCPLCS